MRTNHGTPSTSYPSAILPLRSSATGYESGCGRRCRKPVSVAEDGSTLASSTAVSRGRPVRARDRLIAVERVKLAGEAAGLLIPGGEEHEQPRGIAGTDVDRSASRAGQCRVLGGRSRLNPRVRQIRVHRRTAGQHGRGALGEQLTQLRHRGVGHLGHVQPREPARRVDHEQSRRVSDLPGLDRRLDPVVLPDLLELRQRPGEEPPRVEHPVQLGIGPHVLERDRRGIGVNPQQLHLRARLAQHRLGVQHRGGRQRAHRGALGVVEREDHDLAAERVQRDGLPELI